MIVADDASLIEYLATTARSFLFSTGLNPPAAAAARKALEVARQTDRAQQLRANAAYLRSGLDDLGFEVRGTTHIVPVLIRDPVLTGRIDELLRDRGVLIGSCVTIFGQSSHLGRVTC